MKFIRNLPDVKYTSLSLLYFPAYNGDTNKSNNSIKKLIVPATFNTSWAGDRIKIVSKKSEEWRLFHQTVPRFCQPTVIRASVKAVKAFTRCLRR